MNISRNGVNLQYKNWIFPGGEIGVKLNIKEHFIAHAAKTGFFAASNYQTVTARIQNSNDVIELVMLVDALREIDNTPINVVIPYMPYQQQDRVCDIGESFSLKAFANIINSLDFRQVNVFDPHSDVCNNGLINNLKIISRFDILNKWPDLINVASKCKLISPDAGANKKTAKIAGFLTHKDFIRADKLRNLETGEIIETIVYCDDFKNQDIIVFDDICVGGRTFTGLAKVCKAKNCGKFILYITHGVFSNGVKSLLNNGIDEIYTTNSFKWASNNFDASFDEKVNVLKLEDNFLNIIS